MTFREPGYVYIIKARPSEFFRHIEIPDVYKIGLSSQPDVRLKELSDDLYPFLILELLHKMPVSNMYDVEQKLHVLYDDKRVGTSEWFVLMHHDIDAIINMSQQLSAIARPVRKRYSSNIVYNSSKALVIPDTGEIKSPTELQSLIYTYIKGKRKMSKKLIDVLNSSFVNNGMTMKSPEELWATDPDFKIWAEKTLKELAKDPLMVIERAVYTLRFYPGPRKPGERKSKTENIDLLLGDKYE